MSEWQLIGLCFLICSLISIALVIVIKGPPKTWENFGNFLFFVFCLSGSAYFLVKLLRYVVAG